MAWLFSRRSSDPDGTALYAAIVAETRRKEYYLAAAVPDTIDGRFAVLSTLLALAASPPRPSRISVSASKLDKTANRPSIVSGTPPLR